MDVELIPEQPDAVAAAIEALVAPPPQPQPQADPWWQAGLDDALSDET